MVNGKNPQSTTEDYIGECAPTKQVNTNTWRYMCMGDKASYCPGEAFIHPITQERIVPKEHDTVTRRKLR